MIVVTPVYEDGGSAYLVRGTQDVDEARSAASAYLAQQESAAGALGLCLLTARPGLYRWNPCNENSCYDGGGHRRHLGYASRPGRGVFPGVYFS